MKFKSLMAAMAAALMTIGAGASGSIEIIDVGNRYPWNGKVDCTVDLSGVEPGFDYRVEFTLSARMDGDGALRTAVVTNDLAALNGDTAFVLDTAALLGEGRYSCGQLKARLLSDVAFIPGDYIVVDLQTGEVAETNGVTSAAIFNTDEYKTVKMAFRRVPSGRFLSVCMATNGFLSDGFVTNLVELSEYCIAVFPVTVAQYNAVMGEGELVNGRPKDGISWNEFRGDNAGAPSADTFVDRLARRVESGGYRIDLCTSFQWECAARAGSRYAYFFDNTISMPSEDVFEELGRYAWYKDNAGGTNHVVGCKLPNALGLYDIYGNAYACCRDWYENLEGVTIGKDYAGPATGKERVCRGGSFSVEAEKCSSVFRDSRSPQIGYKAQGFRLVAVSTGETNFNGGSAGKEGL